MCQKGNTLGHEFYVPVGKQCRTENAYAVHQHNILYKLTNALLLLICFKLVMKSKKSIIYFHFSKNIFGMLKT